MKDRRQSHIYYFSMEMRLSQADSVQTPFVRLKVDAASILEAYGQALFRKGMFLRSVLNNFTHCVLIMFDKPRAQPLRATFSNGYPHNCTH